MNISGKGNWRHRKRVSDEQIARRLREAQDRLNRIPRATDFKSAMRMLMRNRFGSWGNGIKKLLDETPERHYWSDEELLSTLRELHARLGRFPEWNDVRAVKPSLTETIRTRFGGLNAALEKAIGTSPRVVLLAALRQLTPPGCDVATTQEIVAALNDKRMTAQRASMHLCELRRNGLVQQGRYNIATWWRLTPAGREFLREKNGGRYGNTLQKRK